MLSTLAGRACSAGKMRIGLSAGRFMLVKPAARTYARGTNFSARPVETVKSGKTLKQRLMSPTTGTPFAVGSLAASGAAVLGVGALCYYGAGLSKEVGILEKSAIWPQYVRDRVHSTYMYLGGSLALTAASAVAVARNHTLLRLMSGNGIGVMLGSLAAVIGTGMVLRSIPYKEGFGTKQLAWMVHTGTLGAILAPLCLLGGPVLVRAAAYTAGIVAGLSAVAVCAPSEKFLNWAGPLSMGLGFVFVSSIGTWFLPPTSAIGASLASVAIYGGLVLFSAFLLYDTQRVVKMAEHYPPYAAEPYDPVNAQISIYLDILNIFMRLAMIMSGGGNRRK